MDIVDDGTGGGFYQFINSTGSTVTAFLLRTTRANSSLVSNEADISPIINQSGTAGYTALLINPTETATGSGAKRLISAQVGGVDRFVVDNTGAGIFAGNVTAPNLMVSRVITVTSGNITAAAIANTDYVYFVAGAHTVSLPAASGNTNLYTIKNNHSADITIDTVGTETIDGTASISLAPDESVQIISNGTNYFIV